MVVSQRGHCSSGGAAVPVAGQRHELGQGSRGDRWTRVRVRQLTARARHHVVQSHRLRPRVPPAQRYLGADLRSITHLWALGHGPRFPTAPADIPVLEGWGIVALCAATLLILSAQSIRSVSTASPATRTRWPAVSIVLVGAFMASLDSFILIVAGPGIQTDLGASDGELQWILAGYQLTFAVFLITGGCLADLLGRRRMFITGMTLFTLASVACAVSPTAGSLVVARLVEGLGAALMLPQAYAVIVDGCRPRSPKSCVASRPAWRPSRSVTTRTRRHRRPADRSR